MDKIQIRPRFTLTVPISPTDVLERLRLQLDTPDRLCEGVVMKQYAILRILQDQQHYWSPRLSLDVIEHENGAEIHGLYGPRATVWTMFAGFYIAIVVFGVVGTIFGLTQWNLGIFPYGLWAAPISIALLGLTYYLASVGQKMGHEQMLLLRSVLDKSLASVMPGPSNKE